MIEKIKNYALIILFVLCCVFAFMLWCQEPKVVKSTTTLTKIEYKDKVVNRDTVTEREIIKYKDGTEKIVEKIVNRDVIKEKEVTKEKEVEVVKYQSSEWGVSLAGCVPISYPLTPQFQQAVIYRKIIGTGYLGLGYGSSGAIISVMILF